MSEIERWAQNALQSSVIRVPTIYVTREVFCVDGMRWSRGIWSFAWKTMSVCFFLDESSADGGKKNETGLLLKSAMCMEVYIQAVSRRYGDVLLQLL